ncbi:hypothetical protein [Aurantibacillus circumpalustris]|uniref:hypothetical protein n=1 Tax=Aurantibacillus circumpalustris TaxID=3036359 RepID=UPI00295BC1D2|nr:hypothetical protein [Aurantibacillus circumpalustris]
MKTLKNAKFVLLSTVLLAFNYSCKKNDIGGDAEIHVLVYHHDTPIKASTLYVKFDAKSEPSDPTSNYDLKLLGEEDENHVHVEGLRAGNYYLYAVGYDSIANKEVSGGMATEIKWSERKKLKEVTLDVGH